MTIFIPFWPQKNGQKRAYLLCVHLCNRQKEARQTRKYIYFWLGKLAKSIVPYRSVCINTQFSIFLKASYIIDMVKYRFYIDKIWCFIWELSKHRWFSNPLHTTFNIAEQRMKEKVLFICWIEEILVYIADMQKNNLFILSICTIG